jgi:hypothetical protein
MEGFDGKGRTGVLAGLIIAKGKKRERGDSYARHAAAQGRKGRKRRFEFY